MSLQSRFPTFNFQMNRAFIARTFRKCCQKIYYHVRIWTVGRSNHRREESESESRSTEFMIQSIINQLHLHYTARSIKHHMSWLTRMSLLAYHHYLDWCDGTNARRPSPPSIQRLRMAVLQLFKGKNSKLEVSLHLWIVVAGAWPS